MHLASFFKLNAYFYYQKDEIEKKENTEGNLKENVKEQFSVFCNNRLQYLRVNKFVDTLFLRI